MSPIIFTTDDVPQAWPVPLLPAFRRRAAPVLCSRLPAPSRIRLLMREASSGGWPAFSVRSRRSRFVAQGLWLGRRRPSYSSCAIRSASF